MEGGVLGVQELKLKQPTHLGVNLFNVLPLLVLRRRCLFQRLQGIVPGGCEDELGVQGFWFRDEIAEASPSWIQLCGLRL